MVLVVRHDSPFAGTEPPPPPVVLLLMQTDLDMQGPTDLLIHKDLEFAPGGKKTVSFAPKHTYPPPPNFDQTIPAPLQVTRCVLQKHRQWEGDEKETQIIKVRLLSVVVFYLLIYDFRVSFTGWWMIC